MRLLLCLSLAIAPLWAAAQPKAPPAMPVRAVPAKVAPAILETGAVGTLRADEAVTIRPEVAGRIEKIQFAEGQQVKQGSLLVTLDAGETRAQVQSSSVQASLEKQRLERAEDLFRKGFSSQQSLDEQRSVHARAAAKLREDQVRLAKSEIRAPFAGVAGLRQVSEGAYVAAGTDIARLEKLDQLKLDFRVPETFLAQLKPGQAVRLAVDSYPRQEFRGAIYALEPAIDEQTRTVLVRARVGNGDLKLRPGMFARVQLQLGVREQAVWVPEEAIVPRGQDAFVFRVQAGKAELVQVRTGVRKVGEVEILKGLEGGDLVVTEGTQRIGPGSAVNVMPEKPAAASAPDKKG